MTDRRQRHKDRTSAAIVSAALELFTDTGFESTTVEQIAARAHVSPVTIFRYFGSKEAILFDAFGDEPARLRDIVRSMEPAPDSRTIVVAALLRFAEGVPTEQRNYLQRSRIIAASPRLQRAAVASRLGFEVTFAEELAKLCPDNDGGLAVQTTAASGLSALHMAMKAWRDDTSDRAALEDYLRRALTALWPDLL